MDVRPLLRSLALVVLVLAVPLGLRARRRWPVRRASGIVAGGLVVLALAGFVLAALDLLAPRAPLPDSLSVYYVEGGTLEAASAATGTVRWRYTPSSSGSIFPNLLPPFANGVFYVREDGAVRAVRARDGQQLWAAPVEGAAFQQLDPTADQGVVYATSPASVVALRTADGRQLWQTSQGATPGSATSAPQVANGTVYMAFSAAAASVYALDIRDGAIRWTHTMAGANSASLTVADGIVYAAFGTPNATVVALDAGDGAVRWTYTVDGDAETLAVTDSVLVLSSRRLGLLALDTAAGSLLWQRGDLGEHGDLHASQLPIVANRVVYLSAALYLENNSSRGVVLAMDARTGNERWRTVLDEADVYMSLAGQMLYVGGRYAYALRASDGHVVWRYGAPAQYYQPVAAAGVVFLGSTSPGSFYPFGIGSNDFLSALDARTGALYWRSSADVECMPLLFSS
jgi:outer membrane protein assembly factor BamB